MEKRSVNPNAEKPLQFLGRSMSKAEFEREFPAYANYLPLIRAGADTPHKVEVALYQKRHTSTRPKLIGRAQNRRKAA